MTAALKADALGPPPPQVLGERAQPEPSPAPRKEQEACPAEDPPLPIVERRPWSPVRLAAWLGPMLCLGPAVPLCTFPWLKYAEDQSALCHTAPYAGWVDPLRFVLTISMTLIGWALVCMSFMRRGKSAANRQYIRCLRVWLCWGYLVGLLKLAAFGCRSCYNPEKLRWCIYVDGAHKVAITLGYVGMTFLLRMCVVELETAQGEGKWGRRITRYVYWPTLIALGVTVPYGFSLVACSSCGRRQLLLVIVMALWTLLYQMAGVGMTLRAFGRALELARASASSWSGQLRDARMETVVRTRWQQQLLVLCCSTTAVFAALFVTLGVLNLHKLPHDASDEDSWHLMFVPDARSTIVLIICDLSELVDFAINGFCLLGLSGLMRLWPGVGKRLSCTSQGRLVVNREGDDNALPSGFSRLWPGTWRISQGTSQGCLSVSGGWDDKVRELSRRGVTVEKLLDFYATLGRTRMPHWDPRRHSTANVVRQAVVPGSRSLKFGPCAMATILMEGRPLPAKRMVTHCWGAKFSDLVSIVVADALGLSTYKGLSAWLAPSRIEGLRQHIRRAGTLHRAYWICALSVNQHSCICEGGPMALDPVLGREEPRCDCGCAKRWNDTPPLNGQGESCACEINKFDDMMLLLAREDPDFTQVVAIDRQLLVFQRAWCIAEIFLAHACGMRRVALVYSEETLRDNRKKFENLRVEDMEASRQEDKEMILEKVGNPTLFNEELRKLVQDRNSGLLSTWWDAIGTARDLGNLARSSSATSSVLSGQSSQSSGGTASY